MRILVAIVHHWNPNGAGHHASLRPQLEPRLYALQDQLLALRRLDTRQGVLNISTKTVDDANHALRHQFTIKIVTDGEHHVLNHMEACYKDFVEEVVTAPPDPRHLGFEAQRVLADGLREDFDLYVYLEDDLLIYDPLFFHKIFWFQENVGNNCVLMPNRYELFLKPSGTVDRLYIDGAIPQHELREAIPNPPQPLTTSLPGGQIVFESPQNPHSGCFALTHSQLKYWTDKAWFLDHDCTLISPLESAATLGLLKTFTLYKPHIAYASFLELQHWGISFRNLIGSQVSMSPGVGT